MRTLDIYTKITTPLSEISTKNVKLICGDDKKDSHKLLDKTKLIIDESINIGLYPEGLSFTTLQTWWRSNNKKRWVSSLDKEIEKKQKIVISQLIIDYKPDSFKSTVEEYKAHYIIVNLDYIRFIHKVTYDTFPIKLSKFDIKDLRNSIMLMKKELQIDIFVNNI